MKTLETILKDQIGVDSFIPKGSDSQAQEQLDTYKLSIGEIYELMLLSYTAGVMAGIRRD